MSTSSTFWKRVGGVFRTATSQRSDDSSRGASAMVIAGDEFRRPRLDQDARSSLDSLFPWRERKNRERAELRDRHSRVVELLDAMKTHFESQDLRAQQLNASIERVAGTLERIANVQQDQSRHVAALSSHVESAGKNAAALLATTVELPAALQAQADAVRTVARRLEQAQTADLQLADTLQRFGGAVDSLHQSGQRQVDAIQRLNTADERHQDALKAFMREQSRRVYIVCGALGLLLVVAIVLLASNVVAAR